MHIDMYRLENPDDLQDKGILEAIDQYDIVFIERPRREYYYADESWTKLVFERKNNTTRIITQTDL